MLTIDKHIQGLIFDCDGTLIDSMPIHWECWHGTFAKFGLTCPHEFLDEMKGVPTHGIVEAFNTKFGHNVDIHQFTEEKERLAREKLLQVQPIPVVAGLAQRMAGKLPMAVASGGPYATVSLSLKATGLYSLFETFVTADDPVKPKPAPDIFLEAARRIGILPEHCQVFEDSDLGLQAARDAGMVATDIRPLV